MEKIQNLANNLLNNQEQVRIAGQNSFTDAGLSIIAISKQCDNEAITKSINTFKKLEVTIAKTETHLLSLNNKLKEYESIINCIHRDTKDILSVLSVMEGLSLQAQLINKDIIEARDLRNDL